MGGHIVVALQRMAVIGVPFGYQTVENRFQVDSDIRIGIFIDRQRRRGVADKQMQQPGRGQFRQTGGNFVRHQVETAGAGTQRENSLCYHGPEDNESGAGNMRVARILL